jgi:hypothetical protein
LWDFAVEMEALHAEGLTVNMLRWLVCKGFVEHGRELTAYDDVGRTFQRNPGLRFAKGTCFVLTEVGLAFVRETLAEAPRRDGVAVAELGQYSAEPNHAIKPTWDCERQELRAGKLIVKRFKVPATSQQIVLAAFEEDDWPVRIDDPLPPHPDQDPKRRLHDTITSLNRNQQQRLIRFCGDGMGQGIRWEFVSAEENGRQPSGLALAATVLEVPGVRL